MPSRNPGGSSGGTGAAVAASFAAAGMGSDTCGSIRIPSANNNLFGLRGTIGPVEPRRHHPALAHAGHRRPAGADGHRPGDDARRHRRRRSGRRGDAGERRAHPGELSRPAEAGRAQGRENRRGEEPVRRRCRTTRRWGRSIAGRSRRWRRPAPSSSTCRSRRRRTDAPVQRDRRRVQVRPDRLSGALAGRAGALASARFSIAATTRRRSRRSSGAATRGPRPTRRMSRRRGRSGRPC